MRRWLALLLLWAALGAAGLAVARASVPAAPPADVARANDLAQIAAEHWPSLARNDFPSDAPPFAVVAADGRVVLDAGAGVRDDVSAYAARALGLDVVTDGGSVARLAAGGHDAQELLDRHRAYTAFEILGDLLETGPTGTNVNELYLALLEPVR